MIKDLCNHGEKNVLVTKDGAAAIDPDVLSNYSTVENMHSCIKKYHDVYAEDLAQHLSLNERNPPVALATPLCSIQCLAMKKELLGLD
jgi:hypothetical protein